MVNFVKERILIGRVSRRFPGTLVVRATEGDWLLPRMGDHYIEDTSNGRVERVHVDVEPLAEEIGLLARDGFLDTPPIRRAIEQLDPGDPLVALKGDDEGVCARRRRD